MSTKRKSQEIAAKIAAMQAECQTTARAEFAAGLKELFELHPRLKSINWSASDEYNDEGGSYYSSNHEEPVINGYNNYDETSETDEEAENLYAENAPAGAKAIVKAVTSFLSDFPTEFYEEQFGCNSITVTGKGIQED